MIDTFEKKYTDWSIDVGEYKYEGITLNEVEQNLYAIEDQEQEMCIRDRYCRECYKKNDTKRFL